MPGASYRMIGYKAGRLVRFVLMILLLFISAVATLFMAAISLGLLVLGARCIVNGEWQMAWLAGVGTFVCAVGSYLYGVLAPGIWKELRRPNIVPTVPFARGD